MAQYVEAVNLETRIAQVICKRVSKAEWNKMSAQKRLICRLIVRDVLEYWGSSLVTSKALPVSEKAVTP